MTADSIRSRTDRPPPSRVRSPRRPNAERLKRAAVSRLLCHPFVIGELALGNLKNRAELLALLGKLPPATLATQADVMALIERRALHGTGIGWVDAHLLASTILGHSQFWTTDKPLRGVAARLEIDGSA